MQWYNRATIRVLYYAPLPVVIVLGVLFTNVWFLVGVAVGLLMSMIWRTCRQVTRNFAIALVRKRLRR
jgi:hypothetical protein